LPFKHISELENYRTSFPVSFLYNFFTHPATPPPHNPTRGHSSKPHEVSTAADNVTKLAPISLPFHNVRLRYCTQYDILGWFLSVAGWAPIDAYVDSYYRPIFFPNAKWRHAIVGDHSISSFMAQITWPNRSGAAQHILITPQLSGAKHGAGDELQPGPWLRMAPRASISFTRFLESTVRLIRYQIRWDAAPCFPAEDVSVVLRSAQRVRILCRNVSAAFAHRVSALIALASPPSAQRSKRLPTY
jgi:hypothetical protein